MSGVWADILHQVRKIEKSNTTISNKTNRVRNLLNSLQANKGRVKTHFIIMELKCELREWEEGEFEEWVERFNASKLPSQLS